MILCPVCLEELAHYSGNNSFRCIPNYNIPYSENSFFKKYYHLFRLYCDSNDNIFEYFLEVRSPRFNFYVETYYKNNITAITINNELPYSMPTIDACDIIGALVKVERLQIFK